MTGYHVSGPRESDADKMNRKTGPVSVRIVHGFELVTSSPIPLHTARIARTASGMCLVRLVSVIGSPIVGRYSTIDDARQAAASVVNGRAAYDLKQVYSPAQRHAMGQRKCPKLQGYKLCGQPSGVGSVWCGFHPDGGQTRVSG